MATVTESSLSTIKKKTERGERGFPGPAGPVTGGVYPGEGIPYSTGAAWGTSIVNNSANWNTAYGWGNHASAGYAVIGSDNNLLGGSPRKIYGNDDASNYYIGHYAVTDSDGLQIQWYGGIRLGTAAGNVIQILSSGNVGIGTTSPTSILHVKCNTGGGLGLIGDETNDLGRIYFSPKATPNSTWTWIYGDGKSTGYLAFSTGDAERVRIDKDGNVGIGTASPSSKLSINGGLHVGGDSDAGDNNLWIDGNAQEPGFTAGWQGSNWKIQADGDAEFNNVRIRGGLSVYELIINQLHYQNGGLIIGAGAGKIDTIVSGTAGSEVLTFHDPEGTDMVPFTAGAIVMCQRVDINRTDVVKKIVRRVASISGMEVTLATTTGWTTGDDTGVFETGDEVCAIGHLSDSSLDACIYMSATDSDNPFLRVMDGVSSYAKWSLSDKTTVKLQIGNLASLASYDILPANPGYGLYSSNAYLSGTAQIGMAANGSGYGIGMKGVSLCESLYNGDNSALYINNEGYGFGTSKYRNTVIGDGKGNPIVTFIGSATNKALFDGTVECDGIFQADGAATFNNYVTFNSLPSTFNIYFRLAQYTTSERDALSGVGGSTWEGTLIINTTTHKLNFWNGSAWKEITSA